MFVRACVCVMHARVQKNAQNQCCTSPSLSLTSERHQRDVPYSDADHCVFVVVKTNGACEQREVTALLLGRERAINAEHTHRAHSHNHE